MLIKRIEYLISSVDVDKFPHKDLPQFLLIGKSNVGKSSFINAMSNRKNIAYTSSKPGKTQTLNFYLCESANKFMFVDSPGYGYSKNSKETRVQYGILLEKYLNNLDKINLQKVFLILDMRIDPSEDDMLVYNFLKHYLKDDQIIIILTKSDKLSNNEIRNRERLFNAIFSNKMITFSSIKKNGIELVEKEIIN